jgi:hypothetical protein
MFQEYPKFIDLRIIELFGKIRNKKRDPLTIIVRGN